MSKIICNHSWDDPECACALEAMIERRKRIERIKELFGIDMNTEAAKREYYGNPYVFSLLNHLETLTEKYDELVGELQWACNHIMGEFDDTKGSREIAGYRAFNISKRLGTIDQRREMYRYTEPGS